MGRGCCIVGCPFYGAQNVQQPNATTYHVFPDPERELYRHNQWRAATNNPRLLAKDCRLVHSMYRICRRHFAPDCMNGVCRRLLKTAVPTLHLNDGGGGTAEDATEDDDAITDDDGDDDESRHCDARQRVERNTDDDDSTFGASWPKRRRMLDATLTDPGADEDPHEECTDEVEWIEMLEEECSGDEIRDGATATFHACKHQSIQILKASRPRAAFPRC